MAMHKLLAALFCMGVRCSMRPDNISDIVDTMMVTKFHLPGAAVGVFLGDEWVARGAAGVRVVGDPTPLTVEDYFPLGSTQKSMTATVAGRLVERRLLSWTTNMSAVFGPAGLSSGHRATTLLQLLSHTAGIVDTELSSISECRVVSCGAGAGEGWS